MSFLGDLAYILIVSSYLVKDMLWLRTLAVGASLSMISYNFFVPPQPLWVMVRWNVVMLAVNVVQIIILFREKSAGGMTAEEQELYATLFRTMSPMEFRRLMRLGVWGRAPAGRILV